MDEKIIQIIPAPANLMYSYDGEKQSTLCASPW